MGIQRKSVPPAGIVNASGQPEIELEINGLRLSMKPAATADVPRTPEAEREPTGEPAP